MPILMDVDNKTENDEVHSYNSVLNDDLKEREVRTLTLLPYCRTYTYCHGLLERDGVVYKFLSTNGNQYTPAQVTIKNVANDKLSCLSEGEIVHLRTLLRQGS